MQEHAKHGEKKSILEFVEKEEAPCVRLEYALENRTKRSGSIQPVDISVTNAGEKTVNKIYLEGYLGDKLYINKEVPCNIAPGESYQWVENMDFSKDRKATNATVKVHVDGQKDMKGTECSFAIGHTDVIMSSLQKSFTQGKTTLTAQIANQSDFATVPTVSFYDSDTDKCVGMRTLPSLAAGKSVTTSLSLKNRQISFGANKSKGYYAKVTTSGADYNIGNDEATVILYRNQLKEAETEKGLAKVTGLKLVNKKGKKLHVSFKKVSGSKGYQVVYAKNKKFKNKKSKFIAKRKYTLTKLKKKKTYYVKVRAYKVSAGKKRYGSFSAVKKMKIKK